MPVSRRREFSLEAACLPAVLQLLEAVCSSPRYDPEHFHAEWTRMLPWCLRQRLLEELLYSGRLYNTIQARILEVLLAPDVRRLSVRQVRPWYRECFMNLLASGRASGLRVLVLEDIIWLTGSPVLSAPLAATFGNLPHLRQISLRCVCDDGILECLGNSCPLLEEVDAAGSIGVSDLGLRKLCIRSTMECDIGCVEGLRSLFLDLLLEDALDKERPLPSWWRRGVIRRARKNRCCNNLRLMNLSATRVTHRGLQMLHACAPNLTLILNKGMGMMSPS